MTFIPKIIHHAYSLDATRVIGFTNTMSIMPSQYCGEYHQYIHTRGKLHLAAVNKSVTPLEAHSLVEITEWC